MVILFVCLLLCSLAALSLLCVVESTACTSLQCALLIFWGTGFSQWPTLPSDTTLLHVRIFLSCDSGRCCSATFHMRFCCYPLDRPASSLRLWFSILFSRCMCSIQSLASVRAQNPTKCMPCLFVFPCTRAVFLYLDLYLYLCLSIPDTPPPLSCVQMSPDGSDDAAKHFSSSTYPSMNHKIKLACDALYLGPHYVKMASGMLGAVGQGPSESFALVYGPAGTDEPQKLSFRTVPTIPPQQTHVVSWSMRS